ncbi:MAG: FkbM family methyltransferase [Planctomycetota bacterium]
MLTRLRAHTDRRKLYSDTLSFVKEMYGRFLAKKLPLPLPFRNRVVRLNLNSEAQPVFARIGTTDTFIVGEIFHDNEYGWIHEHLIGTVRDVLDLGGNVGLSVRYWNASFPELRKVVVVEPDPENMAMLRRNIEPLSIDIERVEALVVSHDRPFWLDRSVNAAKFTMVETPPEPGQQPLPTVSISSLIAKFPDGIDLLKIDIEGGERELFEIADQWVPRMRNLVIELHGDLGQTQLRAALDGIGLRFKVVPSPNSRAVFGAFREDG